MIAIIKADNSALETLTSFTAVWEFGGKTWARTFKKENNYWSYYNPEDDTWIPTRHPRDRTPNYEESLFIYSI